MNTTSDQIKFRHEDFHPCNSNRKAMTRPELIAVKRFGSIFHSPFRYGFLRVRLPFSCSVGTARLFKGTAGLFNFRVRLGMYMAIRRLPDPRVTPLSRGLSLLHEINENNS